MGAETKINNAMEPPPKLKQNKDTANTKSLETSKITKSRENTSKKFLKEKLVKEMEKPTQDHSRNSLMEKTNNVPNKKNKTLSVNSSTQASEKTQNKTNSNENPWSPGQSHGWQNRKRTWKPLPLQDNFNSYFSSEHLSNSNPFYVLKSSDPSISVVEQGTFEVYDAIVDACKGQPEKISPLRDGSILIKTKTVSQSEGLQSLSAAAGCEVSAKPHPTLNTRKGTIYSKLLTKYTADQIKERLQQDKIINVRQLTRRVGSERVHIPVYELTFNSVELPERLRVGLETLNVRPQYNNPTRCYRCQKFGHTIQRCRATEGTCRVCSQIEHGTTCGKKPICANCGDNHPSSSRECIKYLFEKEVIVLMEKDKLSRKEATSTIKLSYVNPSSQITFAEALHKTVNPKPKHPQQAPSDSLANSHQKNKITVTTPECSSEPNTGARNKRPRSPPQDQNANTPLNQTPNRPFKKVISRHSSPTSQPHTTPTKATHIEVHDKVQYMEQSKDQEQPSVESYQNPCRMQVDPPEREFQLLEIDPTNPQEETCAFPSHSPPSIILKQHPDPEGETDQRIDAAIEAGKESTNEGKENKKLNSTKSTSNKISPRKNESFDDIENQMASIHGEKTPKKRFSILDLPGPPGIDIIPSKTSCLPKPITPKSSNDDAKNLTTLTKSPKPTPPQDPRTRNISTIISRP